ncbi:hypothetical protein TNCV_886561 [Trichonephila clavipes]|uniref:Uncharacterized protein n=1 Tax=Trichonephila clavipes TaxID=2585209 RepID=A0A8X6V060_TRICX|nr:hypothetical protein TNCV_886561 [Trichonephila clavipes]
MDTNTHRPIFHSCLAPDDYAHIRFERIKEGLRSQLTHSTQRHGKRVSFYSESFQVPRGRPWGFHYIHDELSECFNSFETFRGNSTGKHFLHERY